MSLERVEKLLADVKAVLKDSTPEERRAAMSKYYFEHPDEVNPPEKDTLGDMIPRPQGRGRRKSRKTRRRSRK